MARSVTELQTALAEVDASISAALKAQQYSVDSGQGRQSVSRVNLSELREYRNELQAELDDLTDTTGGVQTGTFRRY